MARRRPTSCLSLLAALALALFAGVPTSWACTCGVERWSYQGDIGTHGLHILFITDSDNAQLTVPVDEIDSEQRQVILRGDPGNVGEQYGHSFDKPLVAAPTPVRIPLAPFDSLLSPIVVGIDDLAADTTCCDD